LQESKSTTALFSRSRTSSGITASSTPQSGLAAPTMRYREFGLTIKEREQVLVALEEPPEELAPLRAVLLHEHAGRIRDGLV